MERATSDDAARLKQDTEKMFEQSANDLIRLSATIPPIARDLRVREAVERVIKYHQHFDNLDQVEFWGKERLKRSQ